MRKKQVNQSKKPAQGKCFFIFALQFSTFHYIFKLVQRTFCDGSIVCLEINLVHIKQCKQKSRENNLKQKANQILSRTIEKIKFCLFKKTASYSFEL